MLTFAINQVASEAGELVTGQLTADDIEIGTGEELATSLTYTLSGDPIAGLAINADGASALIPRMRPMSIWPLEKKQVITVNYRVTDPGLNGAAGLFAEKTFTITVKGTNDDPVVDLNGIGATLANATEDTTYEVSVNQLLQGFSDVDATDVLVVQGLTAFAADANGNALDEAAGTISCVEANGVLTGYQFAPVTDYNGNVVRSTPLLMATVLASQVH